MCWNYSKPNQVSKVGNLSLLMSILKKVLYLHFYVDHEACMMSVLSKFKEDHLPVGEGHEFLVILPALSSLPQ